eukprot:3508586-Rhodomonas_salina.1
MLFTEIELWLAVDGLYRERDKTSEVCVDSATIYATGVSQIHEVGDRTNAGCRKADCEVSGVHIDNGSGVEQESFERVPVGSGRDEGEREGLGLLIRERRHGRCRDVCDKVGDDEREIARDLRRAWSTVSALFQDLHANAAVGLRLARAKDVDLQRKLRGNVGGELGRVENPARARAV